MKRLIVTAVCLLALISTAFGQDKSSKDLNFIYIAHDENTAVGSLVDRLTEAYNDARNYPDTRDLILYLANDNDPVIVQVNTDNDNQGAFGRIIEELQTKISHTINPDADREAIVSLFNANDIIDEAGNPRYYSLEWTYYVNSTFWSLGNNEDIIAGLFFIMDMQKMIDLGYLKLYVMYGENDRLVYDKEQPFGTKALYSAFPFMPLPY